MELKNLADRMHLILAACACLAAGTAWGASSSSVTALVGGTVVAVDSGQEIGNATVIIDGERIVSVGSSGSTHIPTGAKVIPMTGKWLIPGLMNMHVHLGLKLPGAAGDSLVTET